MADKRIGTVSLGRGKVAHWYDSDIERPARSFVPGDSRVSEQPGGWRIRTRGDTGGYVMHVYRCEVHGEFDSLVSRADVPDSVPCETCGGIAWWGGSRCGQGKAPGECDS